MKYDAKHKSFWVVSAISNALQVEIASAWACGTVVTFDLGFIDDVEYHIDDNKLLIAESDDEEGNPRINREQRRLLYGIAYQNSLAVEEFE